MKIDMDTLKKLISSTESMDYTEKKMWLGLLPKMTDDQVARLFDILETERKKLEELEIRYQEEIKNLNKKQEQKELQKRIRLSETP